ncbi:sodium:phosphate symporter [Thiomicrospira aerophila AL3]|uniref:Sodium:phosphate symporter n=1 Tax=Thiomicrospira aerophila AL3 TaxID=717772 RepID=W0DXD1_9GAMM|nr:Na/Pi symporter [Thiomicrospira aerophila]AHF01928.1 sodium:phosphate symporter [Thiomicrospira aerophila AL3]
MLKKILFPVIILLLAYSFWISPDFKETAAGIALFLFGMMCLEEGFKAFTGGTLESILRKSTSHQWKSLTFGMTATTLMQSSTLVSLVTISFVSAQMISLAAGIGIIMGANIGTTTGAWLIAGLGLKVDIASYAMPALIFGVIFTLQKSKALKGLGYVMLGVGFLFLGIHYMKTGFEAFQSTVDLTAYAVPGLAGVLLFTLIGVIITTIMQSSHATLLVIIAALATGQVSYENALALAIGANLGSAVTTAIGGMAANLGGKRLAIAHVLFNIITAFVAILFINQFVWVVDHGARLLGIADDSYLLKLALFHTLFNITGVLLLFPFIKQLETLLQKYVTFAPKSSEKPIYLHPQAVETPATAVSAVRKEVQHLFDNAYGLLTHGISLRRAVIDSEESLVDAIKYTRRIMPLDVDDIYENKIKSLHSEIVAFIGEAQTRELTHEATEELYILRQASRDIVEAVKAMKHMHKNLSKHGVSSNIAVREQYDAIRLQIATLLRELRIILHSTENVTSLSLDSLKLTMEKSSQQLMDSLDDMIRARRINPAIATSIMNDEAYVTDLAKNLIEAARTLLHDSEQNSVDNLALRPDEIQTLATNESDVKA